MAIIYLLIGVSLLMAVCFLVAFFWALTSGQNDDLYTPSVRILFEDKKETGNDKNLHKTIKILHKDNKTLT